MLLLKLVHRMKGTNLKTVFSAFITFQKILCVLDEMEPFLKSYYEHFKFKSIDSFQFKEFFLNAFKVT